MNHASRIRIMFWDRACREKLYYPGHAHGFLCAPARSGKFTCTLAYMLGEFGGSCLIIDPKGQACGVTARWRRQRLGQKVYRIDPFNLMPSLPGVKWCPPLAQFDPMATLNPKSRSFAADADNIAEACLPYSQLVDPHWTDGGRQGACFRGRHDAESAVAERNSRRGLSRDLGAGFVPVCTGCLPMGRKQWCRPVHCRAPGALRGTWRCRKQGNALHGLGGGNGAAIHRQ